MKKFTHLLLIILSFTHVGLIAQSAKKSINYQAVILDPQAIDIPGARITGQPLSKGKVCLRFSLLNTAGGLDYEETQQVTTDEYGLVNVSIGVGGQVSNASIYKSFESIVWNSNVKSLKVGVSYDACSSFKQVSTQALNYTPYSLYAETVDYKNVREAPTKLSQFSNDSGYLIPKDLDPIKADIQRNSSQIQTANLTIQANKEANEAAFLVLNQSVSSLDNQIVAQSTSISNINSRISDQQNQISDNRNQIAATNNSLNAQIGGLQGQINTTNSSISNLTGVAELQSNKSTATDLGGASPSDQLYPTQRAAKFYIDQSITQVASSGIPDATTLASGKIKLAGDLGGTANSPTINKLQGSPISNLAPTNGQVLTYDGNSWAPAPSSSFTLPTASSNTLGGVKVGSNLSIDANGVLSAITSTNATSITGTVPVSNGGTGVTDINSIKALVGLKATKLAIGDQAGNSLQGDGAVALGGGAGKNNQGGSSIAIGNVAGENNQSGASVAIGPNAAQSGQGQQAVAIGFAAGQNVQGAYSVAIGSFAGNSQAPNSIALNATGALLNPAATGLYIAPIRNATSSNSLFYNSTTKEITYGSASSSSNTINLASDVTGTLPVVNGGTGASSLTGIIKGNGSNAFSVAISGTDYQAPIALTTIGSGAASFSGSTLNIPTPSSYSLPTANGATLGGIKVGSNLSIDGSGVLSATLAAGNLSGTVAVANGGTGVSTLTGYVKGNGTSAMTASSTIPISDVIGAAPLASPTFTGTPSAPTATAGTNTSQIATTAFVTSAVASVSGGGGTTAHTLGEVYGGGIVFYITSGGYHGLIADTYVYDETPEYMYSSVTNAIKHNSDKSGNLYTDWRIPTYHELTLLYAARSTVAGITTVTNNKIFMSSDYMKWTQASPYRCLKFTDGNVEWINGDWTRQVIAIRSF